MSGQHDFEHHRPRWVQLVLIALYGGLVLLSWAYRERLAALAPSLYGVNPTALLVLLGGYPIFRSAISELLRLRVSADLAVAIAAVAALAIGEYLAAAEVIFIMLVGGAIEEIAVERTEGSIRRLVEMTPRKARVRRAGAEYEVLVEDLQVGDILIVRPGERIPADGTITSGRASINEATITGEPLPANKGPGDEVHAGTLAEGGAIEIETTRVGEDTTLARIARLVEQARERKGAAQQRADRWATWFVPVVLVAAAITWLLTREPVRAVAVLVVACPCALVLATPTAVVAAIGRLARDGILVRGGSALEPLATADVVAFDKTGTLTRAMPGIVAVVPIGSASEKGLLSYAALAESPSEHGMGRLIVEHAAAHGIAPGTPEEFEARAGAGVVAKWQGNQIIVGKAALVREMGCEGVDEAVTAGRLFEERGATLAFCAVNGRVIGVLAAEDLPRNEAAEAIEELRQAGITETLVLTGDHERAAAAVRSAIGIAHQHANLLPHEKADIIARLQARGRTVVAVGDGVNDAPMLATAAVGIAMGDVTTELTAEAADVILAAADLRRIPRLIRFSRRAMATIRTNVFWFALLFNGVGVAASAAGWMGPIAAAIYHQIASLLVVSNSLRLLAAARLEERGRLGRLADGLRERLLRLRRYVEPRAWLSAWSWIKSRREPITRWALSGAAFLYLLSGVYVVGPGEVAVVRRLGKQFGTPRTPGLHYCIPWPVDRITRLKPELVRTVEIGYRAIGSGEATSGYEWESPHQAGQYKRQPEEAVRLTGDENLLDVTVALHYVIRSPHDYLFHVGDANQLARIVGEAAVREALAHRAAEDIMTTARPAIEREILFAAHRLLDGYRSGLMATDVRLLDVHPPAEVVPAFREVASAMEEKRRVINQAEAYANETVPKARGEAASLRLAAEAWSTARTNRAEGDAARFRQVELVHRQARRVMEIRLTLEALEKALAARQKLILTGRSGARRQMWLLESTGVKLQPGAPVVATSPEGQAESEERKSSEAPSTPQAPSAEGEKAAEGSASPMEGTKQ